MQILVLHTIYTSLCKTELMIQTQNNTLLTFFIKADSEKAVNESALKSESRQKESKQTKF